MGAGSGGRPRAVAERQCLVGTAHLWAAGPRGTPGACRTARGECCSAGGPIAQFQSQIKHTSALGTFVAAHAAGRAPAAIAAFTPQAARTTFVRLGTVYAEALATLVSSEVEETLQRLDMLTRDLTAVQAPLPLVQYLRALHTLLQRQSPPGEEVTTFLALFESLYEGAYAGADTSAWLRLFRLGAWLENMYLAAAARDAAALQRGGPALEEVRSTLTLDQGPPEVLAALAQMQRLLAQPALTEGELRTLQLLVQDIQDRLRG